MAKRSSLDPIAEAEARLALRHRRGKALRQSTAPIGQAASRLARKIVPDKGSSLERLKARWSEVVGEGVAKFCRPEKIAGTKEGRVLTLRVIPAAAPLIQHQSEEIRQRISVAAGGDIARLKIVQGPLGGPALAKPGTRPRSLSADEVAWLEEGVRPISDPALRAATIALGKAVLSAETQSGPGPATRRIGTAR